MFHGRFAVSFGWIVGGIDRFLDYFASRCLLERGKLRGVHPWAPSVAGGVDQRRKWSRKDAELSNKEGHGKFLYATAHLPTATPPPQRKHWAVMN